MVLAMDFEVLGQAIDVLAQERHLHLWRAGIRSVCPVRLDDTALLLLRHAQSPHLLSLLHEEVDLPEQPSLDGIEKNTRWRMAPVTLAQRAAECKHETTNALPSIRGKNDLGLDDGNLRTLPPGDLANGQEFTRLALHTARAGKKTRA